MLTATPAPFEESKTENEEPQQEMQPLPLPDDSTEQAPQPELPDEEPAEEPDEPNEGEHIPEPAALLPEEDASAAVSSEMAAQP